MRTDQFMGLPDLARNFLAVNEVVPEVCSHCKQTLPRDLKIIGYFAGMWLQKFPLYRHVLKDGSYADEFLQAAPWSSGPVHFLGLRFKNGTEYLWSEENIEGV